MHLSYMYLSKNEEIVSVSANNKSNLELYFLAVLWLGAPLSSNLEEVLHKSLQ